MPRLRRGGVPRQRASTGIFGARSSGPQGLGQRKGSSPTDYKGRALGHPACDYGRGQRTNAKSRPVPQSVAGNLGQTLAPAARVRQRQIPCIDCALLALALGHAAAPALTANWELFAHLTTLSPGAFGATPLVMAKERLILAQCQAKPNWRHTQ